MCHQPQPWSFVAEVMFRWGVFASDTRGSRLSVVSTYLLESRPQLLYSNYCIQITEFLIESNFTDDTNLWFRFTLGSIFNNWCISCRHWTDFLLTLIAGDRTDYTVNSGDVVEAIESFGQSRRWSFFICLIKTIMNNTYINVLTGYYNFYRAYPVGYSTLTFAISSLIYHKF